MGTASLFVINDWCSSFYNTNDSIIIYINGFVVIAATALISIIICVAHDGFHFNRYLRIGVLFATLVINFSLYMTFLGDNCDKAIVIIKNNLTIQWSTIAKSAVINASVFFGKQIVFMIKYPNKSNIINCFVPIEIQDNPNNNKNSIDSNNSNINIGINISSKDENLETVSLIEMEHVDTNISPTYNQKINRKSEIVAQSRQYKIIVYRQSTLWHFILSNLFLFNDEKCFIL